MCYIRYIYYFSSVTVGAVAFLLVKCRKTNFFSIYITLYRCPSRVIVLMLFYTIQFSKRLHLVIRILQVFTSMEICTHFKPRSEEHTSELQSRFDLVFRLLLEEK